MYPDRIRQLNNYVDCGVISPRAGAGSGFVSIGRLAVEKGVDTTIRAIGEIPEATLTIAGDGPERANLERLAAQAAPGRVRFVGHVSATKIAELNRSARAVVAVARWHENMPLSVLETMGASVPLVVSGLGGLPELVDDGVNGLVVDHDNVDALATALRSLANDPTRSVEMGKAARAKMLAGFDAATHESRIFEIYAEAGAR